MGAACDREVARWWCRVLPAAAVLVGLYLLAWAGRWPHSDMRNAGAIVVGIGMLAVGVLAIGVVAASLAATSPWRWLLVVLPTGLAIVFGVFALAGISSDQQRACGDQLADCSTLLPGL